jgi:UDP-3-O-acyl-N-acetylglucosamine deacetylase
MVFRPAPTGTGIVFVRKGKRVSASLENIRDGGLFGNGFFGWSATAYRQNGASVSTAEHLVGALHAAGVDNCVIELSGRNIPQFANSTRAYIKNLKGNVVQQGELRKRAVVNYSARSPLVASTAPQIKLLAEELARRNIPSHFFLSNADNQ